MSFFVKLDDWLVDTATQPAVDWVNDQTGKSSFWQARMWCWVYLALFVLSEAFHGVYERPDFLYVGFLAAITYVMSRTLTALDQGTKKMSNAGILSPFRPYNVAGFWRSYMLLFNLPLTLYVKLKSLADPLQLRPGEQSDLQLDVAMVFVAVFIIYTMSCHARPQKPKESFAALPQPI